MLTFLLIYFVTSCLMGFVVGPFIRVGMSRPGWAAGEQPAEEGVPSLSYAYARFRTRHTAL